MYRIVIIVLKTGALSWSLSKVNSSQCFGKNYRFLSSSAKQSEKSLVFFCFAHYIPALLSRMRITGNWNERECILRFRRCFWEHFSNHLPMYPHHPTNGTLITGFPTEGVCTFSVPDVDVGFCIWIIFAVCRYWNCSWFYAV